MEFSRHLHLFPQEPRPLNRAGETNTKSIAAESSAAIATEKVSTCPCSLLFLTAFFAGTLDSFADKFDFCGVVVEIYSLKIRYTMILV